MRATGLAPGGGGGVGPRKPPWPRGCSTELSDLLGTSAMGPTANRAGGPTDSPPGNRAPRDADANRGPVPAKLRGVEHRPHGPAKTRPRSRSPVVAVAPVASSSCPNPFPPGWPSRSARSSACPWAWSHGRTSLGTRRPAPTRPLSVGGVGHRGPQEEGALAEGGRGHERGTGGGVRVDRCALAGRPGSREERKDGRGEHDERQDRDREETPRDPIRPRGGQAGDARGHGHVTDHEPDARRDGRHDDRGDRHLAPDESPPCAAARPRDRACDLDHGHDQRAHDVQEPSEAQPDQTG